MMIRRLQTSSAYDFCDSIVLDHRLSRQPPLPADAITPGPITHGWPGPGTHAPQVA
jgi:hypothetical protein